LPQQGLKELTEPGIEVVRALRKPAKPVGAYLDAQYETDGSRPHSRRVVIMAEITPFPDGKPTGIVRGSSSPTCSVMMT